MTISLSINRNERRVELDVNHRVENIRICLLHLNASSDVMSSILCVVWEQQHRAKQNTKYLVISQKTTADCSRTIF